VKRAGEIFFVFVWDVWYGWDPAGAVALPCDRYPAVLDGRSGIM